MSRLRFKATRGTSQTILKIEKTVILLKVLITKIKLLSVVVTDYIKLNPCFSGYFWIYRGTNITLK